MNHPLSLGLPYLLLTALHVILLALALAVAGLYGVDLQRAHEQDVPSDGRWAYAEVAAGLSAVTALVCMVPFVLRVGMVVVWAWDFVLFVLWIVVFGIFGKMYISEDPEGNAGIQRMKNAVWVDLANALGWLVAGLATLGYWWRHRERRSRFTGRAKV